MSNNTKLRHILELSKEDKKKFINSFDIIFSDCDGVLWLASEPIKNSDAAVNLLKNSGKQFICVSNNSMRTDEEYIQKLNNFGVTDVTENNFVHPVKTIIRYLKKINFNGTIYSLADKVFNNVITEAGFQIIETSNRYFSSINAFSQYIKCCTNDSINAVLLDIDINITWSCLVQAQYYLQQPNCIFIIGASDKYVPLHQGFNMFGPEVFIKLLSELTGKEPIVLGKPGKLLGQYLIEHYKVDNPQRVLFIGDALPQDIGFGRNCNFQTLAVLSGATSKEDLFNHKNENEIPDFYADSIGDFIEFFNDIK